MEAGLVSTKEMARPSDYAGHLGSDNCLRLRVPLGRENNQGAVRTPDPGTGRRVSDPRMAPAPLSMLWTVLETLHGRLRDPNHSIPSTSGGVGTFLESIPPALQCIKTSAPISSSTKLLIHSTTAGTYLSTIDSMTSNRTSDKRHAHYGLGCFSHSAFHWPVVSH